jgi:uncharacterized protein YlxW (UPF0749 family)
MKTLSLLFGVMLCLVMASWAQTGKTVSPTHLNGLEARKGAELTSEVTRHAAEVASLQKSIASQQTKLAATTDPKAKAQLQKQLDAANKRLTAAQTAAVHSTASLQTWQGHVIATHKAKSTATINWKSATISAQ